MLLFIVSGLVLFALNNTYSLPNFVFIMADDLGFNDVGWKLSTNTYTPQLDNLRNNEALELDRFYVYPKCSPSRYSLWTGRYTHNIGMQHKLNLPETASCGVEPSSNTTFFSTKLKACLSYKNYFIGKWRMGVYKWSYTPIFRGGYDYFLGYLSGFVDYFTFIKSFGNGVNLYDLREGNNSLQNIIPNNYTTEIFGNTAINIIQTISSTNDDTPFTLMVSMEAPHSPLHESPHHAEAVNNGIYGTGNSYDQRKQFNGMIRNMDYYIGKIIDELKNNKVNNESIWNNTYLLFFSDNGAIIDKGSNHPLRGGKSNYFEGGIRVPALISGGLLNSELRGKVYNKPIHITDIYTTIMDIVNIDTSNLNLDGKSFKHILDPSTTSNIENRSIVINANKVDCYGNYSGNTVCGGIIKDYGINGIFKVFIGTGINGKTLQYGWMHLENQNSLNNSITDCDPYNIGITEPTYNGNFKNTACSNNNIPCLFNLTSDPCEYSDLSQNIAYSSILQELMNELITEYNKQIEPLWLQQSCYQYNLSDVNNYWTTILGNKYEPFAAYFNPNNTSLQKSNTPIYTDNSICTFISNSNTTETPSISPTKVPTETPSATPTKMPTTPTETPSISPTKVPTTPTGTPSISPTKVPTTPTETPSVTPTETPSVSPTKAPTTPTKTPSVTPTETPSTSPTKVPTTPTETPSVSPTNIGTIFVSNITKSWNEAEAHCQNIYGSNSHLISITNIQTRNEISSYLDSTINFAWIGLKDINNNDNYLWIDGTQCTESNALCTTYWAVGQPDINKRCVGINNNAQFETKPCNNLAKPFFCSI